MAVEIGTAIFSYIEPEPGYTRAFNEWYERDHFPATVLAGPGVFAGARFVATRACKEARPRTGTLFGDPKRGSYLAVAWVLPGKQTEWDAWIEREMPALAAADRLFPHREHIHTAVYRCAWARGAVPAAVALDRRFAGVIATVGATLGDAPATVGLTLERTIVSSADPPAHELALAFCWEDPCATFASWVPTDADFASPFVATIPGTDTYTEELW